MRKIDLEHDIDATQYIAPEEGAVIYLRKLLLVAAAIVVLILVWSIMASVDEVAKTRGEIVPVGKEVTLTTLSGGVLTSVLVKEGSRVNRGDMLVELNDRAEQSKLAGLKDSLEHKKEELAANDLALDDFEGGGIDIAAVYEADEVSSVTYSALEELRGYRAQKQGLKRQIAQVEASVSSLRKQINSIDKEIQLSEEVIDSYKKLIDKGAVSRMKLVSAREQLMGLLRQRENLLGRRVEESHKREQVEFQIEELDSKYRHEHLEEKKKLQDDMREIQDQIEVTESQLEEFHIKSPVTGIVKNLPYTRVGDTARPQDVVAVITPTEEGVEIQVKASQKDIAFIEPGQPAVLRLDSYDYARFGNLDGWVSRVSSSSFVTQDGGSYYYVTIRLDVASRLALSEVDLMPGMTLEADIVTGSKTVFQYFWKPVYTNLSNVFSER